MHDNVTNSCRLTARLYHHFNHTIDARSSQTVDGGSMSCHVAASYRHSRRLFELYFCQTFVVLLWLLWCDESRRTRRSKFRNQLRLNERNWGFWLRFDVCMRILRTFNQKYFKSTHPRLGENSRTRQRQWYHHIQRTSISNINGFKIK